MKFLCLTTDLLETTKIVPGRDILQRKAKFLTMKGKQRGNKYTNKDT